MKTDTIPQRKSYFPPLPESNKNVVRDEKWIINDFLNPACYGERYATEGYFVELTEKVCGRLFDMISDENRRVCSDDVSKICRDIKNGDWMKTSNPIKIYASNKDGKYKIGDANHRMNAFFKIHDETGRIPAGCYAYLAFVSEREIQDLTDDNRPRTPQQSLAIKGKDSSLSPIFGDFSYIFREQLNKKLSKTEYSRCADIYGQYKPIIKRVQTEKHSRYKLGKKVTNPIYASLFLFSHINHIDESTLERAADFAFSAVERGLRFSSEHDCIRPARKVANTIWNEICYENSGLAEVYREKGFSGYGKICPIGLVLIAALENEFCGAKHQLCQRFKSGAKRMKWMPDSELLKKYTAQSILH